MAGKLSNILCCGNCGAQNDNPAPIGGGGGGGGGNAENESMKSFESRMKPTGAVKSTGAVTPPGAAMLKTRPTSYSRVQLLRQ